MATNVEKRLRELFTHQESSSSSSLTPSNASSDDMDQPTRSFQSFIRMNAPLPQADPSRPLPPVPGRPRRSSSVYSVHDTRTSDHVESTRGRIPSKDFFLQPVAYSYSQPNLPEPDSEPETPFYLESKVYAPSILRHYRSPTPTSGSSSPTSTYERDLLALTPEFFGATQDEDADEQPNAAEHWTHDISSSPNRYAHDPMEDASQVFNLQDHHMHPSDDLAHSPVHDDMFLPENDLPLSPLLPHEATTPVGKSSHKRHISQEKGLIAMGMDSHTLKDEVDQRARRHVFSLKSQVRSPPRQREPAQPSQDNRSHRPTSISASSRGSVASTNASEDSRFESHIFARDYHALLTDQYRGEKPAEESDKAIKDTMRMVPAPLFFQRAAAKHSRNSSGKSHGSSKKSSTTSNSPQKAGFPSRLMSMIGHGGGSAESSSNKHPKAVLSAENSPTKAESNSDRRATSRLADLFQQSTIGPHVGQVMESRKGSAASHVAFRSPTRTTETSYPSPHESAWPSSPSRANPGKATMLRSCFSRSATSPTVAGTVPKPLGAFLNSAMERAKEGLSNLTSASQLDEEGSTSWETAAPIRYSRSGGVGVKKSKDQKRRDALKRSIRVVGEVDPNAIAVAERLGGVDLGRLR